jgi:hypothetical protein
VPMPQAASSTGSPDATPCACSTAARAAPAAPRRVPNPDRAGGSQGPAGRRRRCPWPARVRPQLSRARARGRPARRGIPPCP